MSTTSAPTNLSSAGMNSVETSTKSPMMRRADDRAPDRAEAAEDGRGEHQQQDLEAELVVEALGHARAARRTGRPASRRPIQTTEMTRSTLMPEAAASAGLSATARVALPSRVRWSGERRRRPARPARTRTTKMSLGVTRIGPMCYGWRAGELGVLVGARRRRSTGTGCAGRSTGRCSRPSSRPGRCRGAAAVATAPGRCSQPKPAGRRSRRRRSPPRSSRSCRRCDRARQRVDAVGDQRAERDQLTVREVRQARRAEDHRQAERGHRQQQREHQAADGELQGLDRRAGLGGAGVADREGDEDVRVELEGDA